MALVTDDFVFLHVPKTGGTTFRKIAHISRLKSSEFGIHTGLDAEPHWHVEYSFHCGIPRVPVKYHHLPRVCMVRNPWDWYVSYYMYGVNLRSPHENHIYDFVSGDKEPTPEGFEKFLLKLLSSDSQNKYRDLEFVHIYNQRSKYFNDMLTHDIGFLTWWYLDLLIDVEVVDIETPHDVFDNPDYIFIPLESMNESFSQFLHTLGKTTYSSLLESFKVAKPANINHERRPYHHYYTDDLRDLVAHKSRYIIEKFNYTFD